MKPSRSLDVVAAVSLFKLLLYANFCVIRSYLKKLKNKSWSEKVNFTELIDKLTYF